MNRRVAEDTLPADELVLSLEIAGNARVHQPRGSGSGYH
jgi:hypothetical protein